ncbi:MAG: hypothetical protein IJT54_02480 [Candidatus Methanomethylophilaceae archaeon]|nr:hypothetical protein [Candidatus Methanomethylophilaceae archaeon]
MNTPAISILAAFGLIGGLVLFILYGDVNAAVEWISVHGKQLLVVVQVIGLFYAGMVGNLKLGAVLAITILTTIFWGW